MLFDKQAWEADGLKKELMGSQTWAMVVALAWMASLASMVSSMASLVLASAALKVF